MENVALQNQLQAIQLGANLAARRQQRQQIEQQMRQSSAEFLLRQNQSELQNKILENNLGQALAEQRFQIAEMPQFQDFIEKVVNVLNDTSGEVKLPAVPMFRSKLFNQEAMKAIGGLEQYSSRAKLMKDAERARLAADRADSRLLSEATDYLAFKFDPTTGKPVRDENGNPVIDYQLLNQKKDESKQSAVEKKANLFIDSAEAKAAASGIPLSESRKAELMQSFIANNGSLKPLPEKMATKLEDEFAVIETIDSLVDGISDFEKRYQGKKFTDFLGKIPSTEIGIKSLLAAEKDPMKQEALGLLSDFMGVVNGTARTTSGLNVTESEAKRIAQEIGGFFDKNSMIKLDRFRNRIERSVRGTIGRNIDRALPAFYERWSMTPFGTRTTAAYSVPVLPSSLEAGNALPPTAPAAVEQQPLPSGFSTPQTNQPTIPAGWGFEE